MEGVGIPNANILAVQIGYKNRVAVMLHKHYPGSWVISTRYIQDKIKDREASRATKNWTRADLIRKDLELSGISLIDIETGTIWYRITL